MTLQDDVFAHPTLEIIQMSIEIYTDGGCRLKSKKCNKPGGWGYCYFFSNWVFEDCGARTNTTNNRMEITAVYEALKEVDVGGSYIINSDSEYVLKTLVSGGNGELTLRGQYTGWAKGWRNWKKKDGQSVKNSGDWKKLFGEIERHIGGGSKLEFKWVKGHSANPGNDLADALCNEAMDKIENGDYQAATNRHSQ